MGCIICPSSSSPIVLTASTPFCPHMNMKGTLELETGKKGALSEHRPQPGHCASPWEGQGQRWKDREEVSQ